MLSNIILKGSVFIFYNKSSSVDMMNVYTKFWILPYNLQIFLNKNKTIQKFLKKIFFVPFIYVKAENYDRNFKHYKNF